ncbi:helix-turn-helix domain-containing protein [Faecalispora sporosphaeroides]|uniref:helix-turn-helix domain-containing protein n=1 Tax=Faecalispora sporosphaeroides TaxID=1549 RepID=UPI0003A6A83F|nr:helix-turn-helix domain-containing protein [Faecalispora sporosphaeroides]
MSNFYLCNSAALQLNLSKMAFKVFSFLSMGANNQTRSCFHSKGTIAKGCEISHSSVVRATRELCDKGLLEIQRRFRPNGRQTSNRYIFLDNPQTTMGAETSCNSANASDDNFDANTEKVSSKASEGKPRLFHCPSSIFKINLSPAELKVYSFLLYRAGKAMKCKPSKKIIATSCSTSLSTISRAIKALERKGVLIIHKQTRRNLFGNNGTSVNLYHLKAPVNARAKAPCSSSFRRVICALLSSLTPSLMSQMTPQGTKYRMKVTYTLRNKEISSQVAKRNTIHKHSLRESHRSLAAKRLREKSSQYPKSPSVRPSELPSTCVHFLAKWLNSIHKGKKREKIGR